MKKTRKSILALLLAVMMLFSFMPATVFAAGVDDSPALTVTLTEASEGAPSDASVSVTVSAGESSTPAANTVAGMNENSIITASSKASMLFLVFFM